MKLLRADWMRETDRRAIEEIGMPPLVLMENAARGAARVFSACFPRPEYHSVVILAGKGNNGGDGLALGRIMHQQGYRVRLILPAPPASPETVHQLNLVRRLGLDCLEMNSGDRLEAILPTGETPGVFIVDALFGTGLQQPVSGGIWAELIEAVNRSALPVAAIDLPSGLSESFPVQAGFCVKADVTVTFQVPKWAHFHPDGNDRCGRLAVVDIGIPESLLQNESYFSSIYWQPDSRVRAARSCNAHKGDFGHVGMLAGSLEKPGAGILAGRAALRMGAGLCTALLPPLNRELYVGAVPEMMTRCYSDPAELPGMAAGFDVILAGPGLGLSRQSRELVGTLLRNTSEPLVIDADALNLLAEEPEILRQSPAKCLVLTPHPGEFCRLAGMKPEELMAGRMEAARSFAMERGVFLVLKGHHSLTAAPDGRVLLNTSGNPGMATAGSGDVLAGVLASLLAQYPDPEARLEIIASGVLLHGRAGDIAARKFGEAGLMAGDIIDSLAAARLERDGDQPPFKFA